VPPGQSIFSFLGAVRFAREGYDFCAVAGAPAQRLFQSGRASMFSQQVIESFVGKFRKRLHTFRSENLELMPSLVMKLDALANHLPIINFESGMKIINAYRFTSESSILGGAGSYVTSSCVLRLACAASRK